MAVKIETDHGVIYFTLEDYMKRNRIKLQEIADLFDKSYQQAGNIKNGKSNSLTFDMIAAMCDKFNCQPGQLFQYHKVSNDKIKSLNELSIVTSYNKIKKMANNEVISAEIHIIYYQEEDYIIFGSPELDIFSDFELKTEHREDLQQAVIANFRENFKIKNSQYKKFDAFIMNMQRHNHWKYCNETKSFIPMPLSYYLSTFDVLKKMVENRPSEIIKLRVSINLDVEAVDFDLS